MILTNNKYIKVLPIVFYFISINNLQAKETINCNISRISKPNINYNDKLFIDNYGRKSVNIGKYIDNENLYSTNKRIQNKTTISKNNDLSLNIDNSISAFIIKFNSSKSARINITKNSDYSNYTTKTIKNNCYALLRKPVKGKWNISTSSPHQVSVEAFQITDLFLDSVKFKKASYNLNGVGFIESSRRSPKNDFMEVKLAGSDQFYTNSLIFELKDKDDNILQKLDALYIGYGTYMIAPFKKENYNRWLHISGKDSNNIRFNFKHTIPINSIIKESLIDKEFIKINNNNPIANAAIDLMTRRRVIAFEKAWKDIIKEGKYSKNRLNKIYQEYQN